MIGIVANTDDMEDFMKKNMFRLSSLFASFALVVATLSANQSCFFLINQPELPKGVKALRKF
jgi:AgrD protein